MRSTGDPITAVAGRPAHARPAAGADPRRRATTGRSSCSTWEYLGNILRGDFGTTISDNRPVTEVVLTYGAATLELAFYALLVALLVGIPLGRIAAARRDRASTRRCASPGSWPTRRPCSSPASCSSSSSPSGWTGCRSRGAPRRTRRSSIQRNGAGTGHLHRRRDQHRRPRRGARRARSTRSCPPLTLGLLTGGHLPAARPHQRHRHAVHRLRRGGPLPRRQRAAAAAPARVAPRARARSSR